MPDDFEVETPAGQVVVLPADKARAMLAAGLALRIRRVGSAAWCKRPHPSPWSPWARITTRRAA